MQRSIKSNVLRLLLIVTFIMLSSINIAVAEINNASFFKNFENSQLVDQNNQPFNIEKHQGKLVLFNFIYTQCSTVCPIQSKQLTQVRKSLPPDLSKNVVFISVTLDPLSDKPKKLKAFAKKMQLDEKNWYFLTGNQDSIVNIVNRLELFGDLNKAKSAKKPDDHKTALWLVDKRGMLMMQYSGVPVDVERLTLELKQLSEMN